MDGGDALETRAAKTRAGAAALVGAALAVAAGCGGGGGEVEAGFARLPDSAEGRVPVATAPTPGAAEATEAGFVPRPTAARDRSLERVEERGPVAGDRPVVRPAPGLDQPPHPGASGSTAEPVSGAGNGGAAEVAAQAAASGSRDSPREAAALEALERGAPDEAARVLSDLILGALVSGGGGEDTVAIERWVELLRRAQARHRWRAQGDWPAVEARVEPGEGLIVLRKRVLEERPSLLLSTGLIARANQLVRPDVLRPGDVLRIPVERAHVLVDLSARYAFYLFGDEVADAWPVGIGKPGHETPPGEYTVGIKQQRPPWHPRGRAMVPYGDPENPLGSHWVGWLDENGRATDVGFHGTPDESGVGGEVSSGCIRMRDTDVEVLHDTLPQGARVVVQP